MDPAPVPPSSRWCFDGASRKEARPRATRASSPDEQPERALVCVACEHLVTHPSARIEVAGRHEHAFANPHGIPFLIGCFGSADGCAAVGAETLEWTWFAGYAWSVALCRGCAAHLGWRYRRGPGAVFFGLIVSKLRLADGPPRD